MAIDETIWGGTSDWSDVMHSMAKRLNSPMYTLLDNTLTLNERVDNSVCFCGAIQDKYTWHKANPLLLLSQYDSLEIFKQEEITNMLWLWTAGGNQGDFKVINWDNNNNRWAEYTQKSDILTYYFNANLRPIFNIKINKLLLVPVVIAYRTTNPDESYDDPYTMTLATWINSGHTTYPYLATLRIEPYVNHGTDNAPDWRPAYDSYDHYFICSANNELSEDAKNLGSQNQTINYSLGGYASWKFSDCIMGINTDFSPYWSSGLPYGFDKDFTHYISSPNKIRYCREYSEDLIEEIRHQLAFFGVFFIGDKFTGSINTLTITSSAVYCGVIDENGYTHGDYSHGSDNEERQQFNWEDSSESDYDPYAPLPLPDDYLNHGTHLSATAHAHGGNYYFSDSASSFTTLLNEINNITVPSGGWQEDNTFYGQEPLSCIIESRLIFMQNPYTDNVSAVQLGAFTSEDVSLPFKLSTEIQEYVYPSIKVQNYYNDFRDYSPYTSVFLWFPFCGSLELDTNIVMGHNINLIEEIDPLTGDIKVIVKVDRAEYYTMTGNCACDLSVSGFNMSQYAQTRLSLQMQQVGAQFNAAASLIGGLSGGSIAASLKNPTGATLQMIGGGINYGGSLYQARQYKNLNFKMKPSVGRADKAAGNIEEGAVYLPMIIVTRPRILPEYENSLGGYIAQNGIATHTIGKIGDQTGFVQCENPHVDVTATPEEQAQIAQLLESGIRIK